jgi:putative heme-binding domain-containing protein
MIPARTLPVAIIALFAFAAPALAPVLAQQSPHVVTDEPLSPEEQAKKFHLPPGFEIQLVAAEPQIAKPINLNFDARGRLYVTQTVEYPQPGELDHGRDAVQVLEDRDGDGRYETVSAKVEGLNIPIGVTPVEGGDVVLFSIPNIYRAADANGDGVYERRTKLLGPFGYEDTHGLNNGFTRWLDGWIYACHGFRNTSSVSAADGSSATMNSGNTYRFRADGSRIEQFTWGQVNPFGLAFDPLGNIYTADCHTKPMYQLLRGGYYPSFGEPDDGLGFAPMLIEHSHGSTGIGGIVYYAAGHFPPAYRDVIFVGNPITHRVNCDRLERHGSTYRGVEMPDFLVCDDPWFRPVDLQLGPDGALYVADFYNCIVGHYEVPLDHPQRDRHRGRIWRIVYRGAKSSDPSNGGAADPLAKSPDLTALDLAGLWDKLDDPNVVVRTLATHEIVDRHADEAQTRVPAWMRRDAPSSAVQRAHGLWICERLGVLDDGAIAELSKHAEPLVRVHLVKALAERTSWDGGELDLAALVRERLGDDDAFVRRAAVEALARHPHAANIEPLLEVWRTAPADDTHLIHAARIALRNQLKAESDYDRLALLDGPGTGDRTKLLDVALGVRDAPSAGFVFAALREARLNLPRRDALLRYALLHVEDGQLPALLELVATKRQAPVPQQIALLETSSQALSERGADLPAELRQWGESLTESLLTADSPEEQLRGVALARELRLTASFPRLRLAALDRKRNLELRGDALDACVAARPDDAVPVSAEIVAAAAEPLELRIRAAKALGGLNRDPAREALAASLATAPHLLAVEIAAGLARTPPGVELLLAAVKAGESPPRLLLERPVQQSLFAAAVPNWTQRVAALTKDIVPLDKQLDDLIARRRGAFAKAAPDANQGAAVFKKSCAACHRIGDVGNKIGPELDGIGNRGLDRVLEDVLDPSRNVDPAFRTTILETSAGQVLTGLTLREEGKLLILVDGEGKEHRIPLDEIEARKQSPLSAMPANVGELVKGDDFHHLLAYLLAQRAQKE